MSKEAMKLALGKIISARECHPNAVDALLFEAEEILEEALAEQPAQQEPKQSEIFCGVDFADGVLSVSILRRRADDVAELLHAEQIELPPQRTWVGLTHEEHMEIMTGTRTTSSRMAAVEAKLKEKNT